MAIDNTNNPPDGFPKLHPIYGEYQYTKDGIVIYLKDGNKHGIDQNTKSYEFLKDSNGKMYYYDDNDGVLHTEDNKIKLPPPTNFDFDPKTFTSPEALLFEEFVNSPDNNVVLQDAYDKYNSDYGTEKPLTFFAFKKSLVEGNKYVYATKNAYVDQSTLNHPMWDLKIKDEKISTSGDKNVFAKDYAKYIGYDSTFNDDFIKDYQGTYVSLAKTSVDPKYKEVFVKQNLSLLPDGVTDQMAIEQLGKGITPRDGWWGNTNNQQKVTYTSLPVKEKPIDTPITPSDIPEPNMDLTVPSVIPSREEEKWDSWFAPDITNYVGALTNKINRYEPSQGKMDFVTPGYDLLDPTRQLAANQEQMSRFSNQLENTVDPNIALATMLGASGQGFQNAANTIANVENQNIGIVNQAYQNQSTVENQEIAVNEAARQKYIAEMAMLNENYDKAQNLKKWGIINAWNQGHNNFSKDQMMEHVLFPQVHTNNITGRVSVVNGKNPLEPDMYQNPMTSGVDGVSTEDFSTLWNKIPGSSSDKLAYIKALSMYANPKLALNNDNSDFDRANYTQIATPEVAYKMGGYININDYLGL